MREFTDAASFNAFSCIASFGSSKFCPWILTLIPNFWSNECILLSQIVSY